MEFIKPVKMIADYELYCEFCNAPIRVGEEYLSDGKRNRCNKCGFYEWECCPEELAVISNELSNKVKVGFSDPLEAEDLLHTARRIFYRWYAKLPCLDDKPNEVDHDSRRIHLMESMIDNRLGNVWCAIDDIDQLCTSDDVWDETWNEVESEIGNVNDDNTCKEVKRRIGKKTADYLKDFYF